MTTPVWILSVDLQTKTATFTSGMADAARSARGAFSEIRSGGSEMGRELGGSMMEARHGVMLLGEEFGIHLPRALTTFIASIGPVGAAMEAAFPFLAIAVGATLLIEALVKVHEAGEKLTDDQVKFGTAVQNSFNQLEEKILTAQIRSDELRNDHLGALRLQLELIDRQSMNELVKSLEEVAKASDTVFGDLKSHWYTFGIGATGAKHALDQFQIQYDDLLAKGKDKEAADLLRGTRDSAERVLELQKQAAAGAGSLTSAPKEGTDHYAAMQAELELKKSGVGYTEKEVQAQETLVNALNAQVHAQGLVAELKKQESDNATRQVGNEAAAQTSARARDAAQSQLRMGEQAIAADRAVANERLQVTRASIAARLDEELSFAARERDVQAAANQAEIAALDKSSKDYTNQLASLHNKSLEIEQSYQTQVTELKAKSAAAQAAEDLRNSQEAEREAIDATRQGSAERLAAINAAIQAEAAANLQDTQRYRELLGQKVEVTRQMSEEQAQQSAEAGRIEADNAVKMGDLAVAAEKEANEKANSIRLVSDQERVAQETRLANEEYEIKRAALERELTALDTSGKDYLNKKTELLDREKQLQRQHENELTTIQDQATKTRNQMILSAQETFVSSVSRGLSQVIMGHESMAKAMAQMANSVVSTMLEEAIRYGITQELMKVFSAKTAAANAYASTSAIPLVGPALAPAAAASALSTVMAFAQGGIVPGIGGIDNVPAMLTPGEAVLPRNLTDVLLNAARNGGSDGGDHYHIHSTFHVTASALDSDGMDAVLEKHADKIQRHFERTLRKMNR